MGVKIYLSMNRAVHPESAGIREAARDCAAEEGGRPEELSMIQTDSCVIKLSAGDVSHLSAIFYHSMVEVRTKKIINCCDC